eukprot:scaffold1506_cov179-Amphora_coffeaeformis.AAC.19
MIGASLFAPRVVGYHFLPYVLRVARPQHLYPKRRREFTDSSTSGCISSHGLAWQTKHAEFATILSTFSGRSTRLLGMLSIPAQVYSLTSKRPMKY